MEFLKINRFKLKIPNPWLLIMTQKPLSDTKKPFLSAQLTKSIRDSIYLSHKSFKNQQKKLITVLDKRFTERNETKEIG